MSNFCRECKFFQLDKANLSGPDGACFGLPPILGAPLQGRNPLTGQTGVQFVFVRPTVKKEDKACTLYEGVNPSA